MFNCPRAEEFDVEQWRDDPFAELQNDDFLWACAVRCYEEFRHRENDRWGDEVYDRLIQIGTLDWQAPNTRGVLATRDMRYSAAISSRLFQRIRRVEDVVGIFHDA